MAELAKIVLLTCGGTIVSSGDDALQMTGYRIRDFGADALLRAVPQLGSLARIELHEVARIDSMSMTSEVWCDLGRAVAAACADPEVAGVVVTHGTDTMEESAWFTELVAATDKPVVFTGAMRPATALSAEGPLNLLNAVRVALDPAARGRGVLVAVNDVVVAARAAVKCNTTNVAAFRGRDRGPAAIIAGDSIAWLEPAAHHTTPAMDLAAFSAAVAQKRLPRVDILYAHADDDGVLVRAAVAAGARGIVVAGMGNGSLHERMDEALAEAAQQGVIVVRASRVEGGVVTNGLAEWQERNYIPAGTLSPQKARVVTQLALLEENASAQTVKAYFERL